MPRAHKGNPSKGKKVQKPKNSQEADRAVLRAQLELARAERARAEEKIQRLERQFWGEAEHSEAETSDDSEAESQQSDVPRQGLDVGERFLDMLLQGVGDGFPASIRETAQEALRDGPQPDDECRKGCNWVGGIRLAWTSPPTVREVKRHVEEHFPRPIQPEDLLNKIDGKFVDGLSRRDILDLLRKFKKTLASREVETMRKPSGIRPRRP